MPAPSLNQKLTSYYSYCRLAISLLLFEPLYLGFIYQSRWVSITHSWIQIKLHKHLVILKREEKSAADRTVGSIWDCSIRVWCFVRLVLLLSVKVHLNITVSEWCSGGLFYKKLKCIWLHEIYMMVSVTVAHCIVYYYIDRLAFCKHELWKCTKTNAKWIVHAKEMEQSD